MATWTLEDKVFKNGLLVKLIPLNDIFWHFDSPALGQFTKYNSQTFWIPQVWAKKQADISEHWAECTEHYANLFIWKLDVRYKKTRQIP